MLSRVASKASRIGHSDARSKDVASTEEMLVVRAALTFRIPPLGVAKRAPGGL
jgi:hypothetical protein